MALDPRVSVVVLTHNRADELARCLGVLSRLPQQPRIIVVDNASTDGSALRVSPQFPHVTWVRCTRNLGAAGRNEGVALVRTPYVAFCDDDTWWSAGALQRAADLLDAHPHVGVISARVLVGTAERLDPTCERMANSPLDGTGLPGPALISFMAGASVMRCDAYREVGGYEPRFFLGAEEALMGLDLAARAWAMVYADDVVTHHHPSAARDPSARRSALLRNHMWIAWLRLPWAAASKETRRALREGGRAGIHSAWIEALAGLPWALLRRRVVPARVLEMWLRVHGDPEHRRPAAAAWPNAAVTGTPLAGLEGSSAVRGGSSRKERP